MLAFVRKNREFTGALAFFFLLLAAYAIASPSVFLRPQAYIAVFISLPIFLLLAVSSAFLVIAGEIDLSFGATAGLSSMVFAMLVRGGMDPFLAVIPCLLAGLLVGLINGVLVTYLRLTSLIVTLGMMFFWRGFIEIVSNGVGIPLAFLRQTTFYSVFTGDLGGFPTQMLWAAGFAILAILVFTRHTFGAHLCCVGDNKEAAREMGINVRWTKIYAFMLVGFAAALVGIIATLILSNFYPTTGTSYLLPVLAAVFVGGTPAWGGVGTIAGAVVGAFTVGFIQTGVIASGFTGYWTDFVYGLVVILSLLGHKFNRPRLGTALGGGALAGVRSGSQ